MVKSKLGQNIDKNIVYKDSRFIEEADKGSLVSLYSMKILDTMCVISIGSINKTYEGSGILYVPIYLNLMPSVKTHQIGVFEFLTSRLILDRDSGDLDIAYMGEPLLYDFVNNDYLIKQMKTQKKLKDEAKNSIYDYLNNDADDEDDDDTTDVPEKPFEKLYETQRLPNVEIEAPRDFNESRATNWVQGLFENLRYSLVSITPDGNCLFETIEKAYASIGVVLTVSQMRNMLSSDLKNEQYETYKEFFNLYKKEDIEKINQEIKVMHSVFKSNKDKAMRSFSKDRTQSASFKDKALEVKEKLKEKIEEQKELLANYKQIEWFKSVTSYEELKEFIKTKDYYADNYAIGRLEVLLNTKIIVLSENENKLLCGGSVDVDIENEDNFNPKYYVIVSHNVETTHYELVGYKLKDKNKRIFRYHELPFDMKEKIKQVCLEKGAGIYSYIPAFKNLLEVDDKQGDGNETVDKNKETVDNENKIEFDESESKDVKNENKIEFDESESKDVKNENKIEFDDSVKSEEALYDENTVFQFYSKSANKYPGKGAGEKLPDDEKLNYKKLSTIKDWRKKLSNFHKAEFELDGEKWLSVEHYYHANKYKNTPEFYKLFTVGSNSEISKDPALAKAAGGKTGKYKGKRLRDSNIKPDENYMDRRSEVFEKANFAKYSQNPELKEMLLATNNAKLVHKMQRSKDVEVFTETMRVRERLRKNE